MKHCACLFQLDKSWSSIELVCFINILWYSSELVYFINISWWSSVLVCFIYISQWSSELVCFINISWWRSELVCFINISWWSYIEWIANTPNILRSTFNTEGCSTVDMYCVSFHLFITWYYIHLWHVFCELPSVKY